ncbi:hypothetical protein HDU93_004571 [Gonapodya sp. JEL0774]|nr:hypothetical protein HDU93_004571 [Gonapodya sp. JEL0774]
MLAFKLDTLSTTTSRGKPHLSFEATGRTLVASHSVEVRPAIEDVSPKFNAGPKHYIPYLKNGKFVGRTGALEALEKKLFDINTSRKVAIVGLGGVGKTQLALEFAHRMKETHKDYCIFWLSAVSMEGFEKECGEIAKQLGILQGAGGKDDAKDAVKRYLSREEAGRWLLILDNADNMDIVMGAGHTPGIHNYLPQSMEGRLVFTTRSLDIAHALTQGQTVTLTSMSPQEAADLLNMSLNEERKHLLSEESNTTELLEELTYLPLAITQACAYLNRNQTTTIQKYMEFLRNKELKGPWLWDFYDHAGNRKDPVAKTWLISFDQIRTQDRNAADLLGFMACIEPKAIPRTILPTIGDENDMEIAINTLVGYAFVTHRLDKDSGKDFYDLHRLVHLAAGVWLRELGDAPRKTREAIRHIATVFPTDDWANREQWRAYLPHATKVLEGGEGKELAERYDLCFRVGGCLQVDGRVREAVQWLERCESGRRDVLILAEDHPSLLTTQNDLAWAYLSDGQVKKAVQLYERVLVTWETTLAGDHPSLLTTQNNLAGAYLSDGQVKKAVQLYERVLAVCERILAEDHPDRLGTQNNLAVAYLSDGQVKRAVQLLQHVVAVRRRTQREDHPDRVGSEWWLAHALEEDRASLGGVGVGVGVGVSVGVGVGVGVGTIVGEGEVSDEGGGQRQADGRHQRAAAAAAVSAEEVGHARAGSVRTRGGRGGGVLRKLWNTLTRT